LDLDQVVFMSDSENSNSFQGAPDIGLQEVIANVDRDATSDDNLLHLTVKQEEECIIIDDGTYDDKMEEREELAREVAASAMFGHEYEIKTIPMSSHDDDDGEVNQGASTSFSADCEIIRIEPPSGMCTPPEASQDLQDESDEEQFAIIEEEEKTDADTSLVDHPYSQPESTNKEFCDDLVQEMLKETGLDANGSAVTLLSKFTEMCEHFFSEDENSQISMYLRSMKRTLVGFKKEAEVKKVETTLETMEIDNKEEEKQPFVVVPMTPEDVSDPEPAEKTSETAEIIELLETEPMTQEEDVEKANKEEEEVTLNEEELPSVTLNEEELPPMVIESEDVLKLKAEMNLVKEIAEKVNNTASDLLKISLQTDEETATAKEKLVELLKATRLELRNLELDVSGAQIPSKNEKLKKKLINDLSDSDSSFDSSDSEVNDSSNLKRKKMPKSGPQTPAIVSSTKEDSGDDEAVAERLSSPASDHGKTKTIDKDIERLLNFETLHNKPAPSKASKVKKVKKVEVPKQKTTGDVSDSYSSLSENDYATEESSNFNNSDSDSTDEEEKMLRRQNNAARLLLLADSDASQSSDDMSDDYGGLTSDDDEASNDDKKPRKEKKLKNKGKTNGGGNEKKLSPESRSKAESVKSETDDENDEAVVSDGEKKVKAKKRIRRDSYEREIFHKGFLEIDGGVEKSSNAPKKQKLESESPTKVGEFKSSPSKASDALPNKNHEVDTSMFDTRSSSRIVDLESMFEKRSMAFEGGTTSAGPSTSTGQKTSKPSTPAAPLIEEDGWISLSSDSDSEISAIAAGSSPRIPNRKKMLSEEELQKETKEAQKAEKQRIERLEKKTNTLTQMMSQRMSQEPGDVDPLILDFDKNQKTIEVHPKLVKLLKKHQVDGVKFMYDTCYGSVSDKVITESGCILAHCMGLGKTLQLITLIHTLICHSALKTKRVLVICPKSTIMNWREEFNQWLGGIDSRDLKIYILADQSKLEDRVKRLDEWYSSKRPGVFLINYESFRNMVNYSGSRRLNSKMQLPPSEILRLQNIITKCFLSPGPDLVVCDEGHLIKNQANAINKAITKIETRRRIILTGTPVQNNLNEYYAMVDWIKPALLGTVKEFNNLYANPIKDGQHVDSTPQMIKKMKQRSLILNRNLSKFVQRKEATVLREFLPEKYEYCIFVPLTKIQEKLYRYFLDQNPAEGGKRLLNDYTALRKIWTHPKVLQNAFDRAMKGELKIDALNEARKRKSKNHVDEDGNEEPDDLLDRVDGATGVKNNWWSRFVSDHDLESLFSSNKLLLLFHILRMCQERGEKVLVFSAFVAVLNVVEDFMRKINRAHETMKQTQQIHPDAQANGYTNFMAPWKEGQDYFRLDGSTKREVRHTMVQRFNETSDKKLRCFLISARAGGQGINLTGANRCIILDTAWNPSADQQNIFRIYRLGQKKPCFVYR
jgi:transcriptional regulator ATRX